MGMISKIAWCDGTFNPWIGCDKVSPGCKNCYAERIQGSFGGDLWGPGSRRSVTSTKNWNDVLRADKATSHRRRLFVASLSDVFEDRDDLHVPRRKLIDLVEKTINTDWLFLTKRPENVLTLLDVDGPGWGTRSSFPDHVWIGTTVEDQRRLDERLPILVQIPSRVKFLSCEPLLERVVLGSHARNVSWVIVGGESGRGARPFSMEWAKSLRDECACAGVPFFFKQTGERAFDETGRPMTVSGAGSDPEDWPEWAREARSFPRLHDVKSESSSRVNHVRRLSDLTFIRPRSRIS